MTSSEAVKVKLMSIHGWSVNRMFPVDRDEPYYQAVNGSEEVVTALSIEELFEAWTETDSVLEQILRVNTIRRNTNAT